jgi:hypothetical protein
MSTPLRGDHCQCPSCGLRFTSTHSFDKHRVGPFKPRMRRCLSEAELTARGWAANAAGYWRKAAPVSAFAWTTRA